MKNSLAFLLVFTFFTLGCGNGRDNSPKPASNQTLRGERTDTLLICSFNIQFLGHFKKKDNEALAGILKDYHIVVIQELVAPPADGTYPNGESFSADEESAAFFEAMKNRGFKYLLSDEDTGTGDEIHTSGTSTEWWVTFFKPNAVTPANDLPSGFLAQDRSNNDDYERVPYAFAFRSSNGKLDFVLISVHLMPGETNANKARRKHELATIFAWIDAHDETEKDFIVLGDMNIEDQTELAQATPNGYLSLNDECRKTNTLMTPNAGRPYDHVMYNTTYTRNEIDTRFDVHVVDLIDAMRSSWTSNEPYPGDPYDHERFRQYYSDHHPILFKMVIPKRDDD
ncbi:MAG: hypothetical protein FJ217_13620 [Ignavibacteria bacterium]|nr:hypothetical protein [Ignavibacteria bacterium]